MGNSNGVAFGVKGKGPRIEDANNFTLYPLPFTLRKLEAFGVRKDSRLLVAVSGGPDSMALAHAVMQLHREGVIAEVAVAHVNHRLRGKESDRDEAAVKECCRTWNLNVFSKQVDTGAIAEENTTGLEETARKIRYDFFEELIDEFGFHFVLTAHTANDQAETLILNMMRGSGVRGLAGIPAKRKLGKRFVLRPWLDVTKAEILEYLSNNNIAYRHDASNDELTFRRNQVRHKVLPALQDIWPDRSVVTVLGALAERMRDVSEFLETTAKETLASFESDSGLSLQRVILLDPFLLHTVLETWIHSEFGHYGLTSEESTRIAEWLHSPSPRMELRRGISLRKDGDVLRLENDGRY